MRRLIYLLIYKWNWICFLYCCEIKSSVLIMNLRMCDLSIIWSYTIWATSWQNQQNDCAPSEDSDQPGHPPSLIRDFAVHMKKHWALSYPLSAQRRFWSDWADAQADLSLRWAHSHFVRFVTRRLKYVVESFFTFDLVLSTPNQSLVAHGSDN